MPVARHPIPTYIQNILDIPMLYLCRQFKGYREHNIFGSLDQQHPITTLKYFRLFNVIHVPMDKV
jgi:hypothetical protein